MLGGAIEPQKQYAKFPGRVRDHSATIKTKFNCDVNVGIAIASRC